MSDVDTSGWEPIGSTGNCACFRVAPGIMVMVPHDGARDDAASARENLAFQNAFWEAEGRPGCVAVIMDRMVEQDPGARNVYAEETDRATTLGYALVGGTFWGRAMASVFLGLRKPAVTTRLFGTLNDAHEWMREVVATRDGASEDGPER